MKARLNIWSVSILLFSSQFASAKIAVNAPVSSPGYKAVERLEAYGCALPSIRILAPLTHVELRASVPEDEKTECQAPESLLIEREVLRLPIQPGEARLRFITVNDRVPLLGQEASRGNYPSAGTHFMGEVFIGSEGGRDWGFAGAVNPGFMGTYDLDGHIQSRFYLHEGYFKAGYRQTEVLYGRLRPDFGNTLHGGLFISGDSKPQDMLKLSIRPHVLGNPLGFLGPVSFETWLSWLGGAGTRSESKLWATAFAFRPVSFLELGWLHAVQLGGDGVPSFDLNAALKTFFYSQDPSLQPLRRESTAFHIGIWVPRKYVKAYSQLFFNQPGPVSGWLADDMGFLGGLWFPKLGETELRIEYVHTPLGLYSHPAWRGGWSTGGTTLGHGIGSDGEALYADLALPAIETWRPTLSFAYESRNRSGSSGLATEWRYGGALSVLKRWEKMEIAISLKEQSVYNFQYFAGDARNVVDFYSELRYFLL